jgi:hypothetical protein
MKEISSIVVHGATILSLAVVLMVFGSATAGATEYHCNASGDKCAVEKSTLTMSIDCMSQNQRWQCARPVVNEMECSLGSTKRKVARGFWDLPVGLCVIFCGNCGGGWTQYGGGTTF